MGLDGQTGVAHELKSMNMEVREMSVQNSGKEARIIEELAENAENILERVDAKKDLKEKRKVLKQTLYGGSEKLKHVIPKGKHL